MPGGQRRLTTGRSAMDANQWPPVPTCSSSRSSTCPELVRPKRPTDEMRRWGAFALLADPASSVRFEIVGCGSAGVPLRRVKQVDRASGVHAAINGDASTGDISGRWTSQKSDCRCNVDHI